MTPEEIERMETEIHEEKEMGFARFSWLAVIEKLCLGDITKSELVCEQNFISCLNWLSYWKEKEAKEESVRKQIKQNKL